jgi:hypothetical protein
MSSAAKTTELFDNEDDTSVEEINGNEAEEDIEESGECVEPNPQQIELLTVLAKTLHAEDEAMRALFDIVSGDDMVGFFCVSNDTIDSIIYQQSDILIAETFNVWQEQSTEQRKTGQAGQFTLDHAHSAVNNIKEGKSEDEIRVIINSLDIASQNVCLNVAQIYCFSSYFELY